MKESVLFETHVSKYEVWFEKYPYVFQSEMAAIREHLRELPENIHGIEVGLGTGRYARELGIMEGVEPSATMRKVAWKRGIEVMDAVAERLPYKDLHFDFILYVTVCHLDDLARALKEAYRVLKWNGSIIIGFIDKEGLIGKAYEAKKEKSTFYKNAKFYTVNEMQKFLRKTGFKDFSYNQVLFNEFDDIDAIETPMEGYGKGSFVAVRAVKR